LPGRHQDLADQVNCLIAGRAWLARLSGLDALPWQAGLPWLDALPRLAGQSGLRLLTEAVATPERIRGRVRISRLLRELPHLLLAWLRRLLVLLLLGIRVAGKRRKRR